MLTLLFIVVLFPWQQLTAYEQLCGLLFTNKNLKLEGHVMNTLNTSSNVRCADECLLNNRCYSANYYQSNATCELNNGDFLTSPASLRLFTEDEGVEYMNNPERTADRCYSGLCRRWPWQCIPEKNEESFKCVPCEAANGTEFLWWPIKNVHRLVPWDKPFSRSIAAFTISVWVNVMYDFSKTNSKYTPFSYATSARSNELTLVFSMNKTIFYVKGKQCIIPSSAPYKRWHHVLITWDSNHGKWQFFSDGVRVAYGNEKKGHVINPGGRLVLGQEQDGIRYRYDVQGSFHGMLGNLNMWDKVLPDEAITDLMTAGCGSTSMTGNIITWSTVKRLKRWHVHFFCGYPECVNYYN